MITETKRSTLNGWGTLLVLLVLLGTIITFFVRSIIAESVTGAFGLGIAALITIFCLAGLFIVNPNEARVLQLFGKYVGLSRLAITSSNCW